MKVLILSGTHSRHLYIHEEIINSGVECAAIVMERENVMPSVPEGIDGRDAENFQMHFEQRKLVESKVFGNMQASEVFSNIPVYYCQPDQLNTDETAEFVRKFSPDMAFIFGTNLIKDPLMNCLPETSINLHLGLSPWYKGSATLFWPFYFLQPQFSGATFHKIVADADAGDILHQSMPLLYKGDGIHDVSARVVETARADLKILMQKFLTDKDKLNYVKQKTLGRLFLSRDIEPHHLRLIYDLYSNKIVDSYLNGNLGCRKPKLVNMFSEVTR
jgi:methionyl-tRNA formyltransferase